MKKAYITPEALTVRLAAILPLASSGDLTKNGNTYTGGLIDKDATDDALVKGSTNLWDDIW